MRKLNVSKNKYDRNIFPARWKIGSNHDGSDGVTLNDTHREKMCFIQLSTRMTDWQLLTIFHMVTQSITFRHTFYYDVLRVRMFEKWFIE